LPHGDLHDPIGLRVQPGGLHVDECELMAQVDNGWCCSPGTEQGQGSQQLALLQSRRRSSALLSGVWHATPTMPLLSKLHGAVCQALWPCGQRHGSNTSHESGRRQVDAFTDSGHR